MAIKLADRRGEKTARMSTVAKQLDAPKVPSRSRVNAKDNAWDKGLVQTNGTTATGKVRKRQSGAMVRTVNPRTPMSAIRSKCLDCSGGSFSEIEFCQCTACPLYRWRFGKRPATVEKRRAAVKKGVSQ